MEYGAETIVLFTVSGTAVLGATHLLAARFHELVGPDRAPVHSGLAGFTSAYVFLTLLPDIGHAEGGSWLEIIPDHLTPTVLFAVALVGFIVFYLMEIGVARRSGDGGSGSGGDGGGGGGGEDRRRNVYRLHRITFTALNAMVAFLLPHHLREGLAISSLYIVAAAVHFLVMDHGLATLHGGSYGRKARLLHIGGLAAGSGVALLVGPLPPGVATEPLLAVLAGAIILQVVRDEIPASREGTAWAFALGALIYAVALAAALMYAPGAQVL